MVDRAVDAVGYQAVDKDGSKERPNIVLDQLIMVTRPTGGLGIPGLYVPSDPGAPDEQSGKGQILWVKDLWTWLLRFRPLTVLSLQNQLWQALWKGIEPGHRTGKSPFRKLKRTFTDCISLQCNVKAYNRYLRDLIIAGRAKPSFVVSHELSLDDAPMAYGKPD